MLVDAFGREVTDIRVSVTKRCNYGCIYCHEEALRVGLKPVKLNMVVFKQTLPHIPRMIEYISGGDGLKLQLIQFMPELVGQQDWMVDIDALKKWLEGRADKILVREMHHRRIYL